MNYGKNRAPWRHRLPAALLALALLLGSRTAPALAYHESDLSLEYVRVADRLVSQFDWERGAAGASYFTGGDTASTDVPALVGRIYSEDGSADGSIDTGGLINETYLLSMAFVPFATGGVRLNGTTDGAGRILRLSMSLGMEDPAQFREADEKARSVAAAIRREASGAAGSAEPSDRELVVRANRHLVQSVAYPAVIDTRNAALWTAYGALVEGEAVCQGYAAAFQLLMAHLGIPSVQTFGVAEGVDHVWNQVLVDGTWLSVDVTFNDPIYSGRRPSDAVLAEAETKYLLLPEEEFLALGKHTPEYTLYTELAKEVFHRNAVEAKADVLREADLFLGDAKGYRLEDGLSRAEMAVMLTRVVGGAAAVEADPDRYAAFSIFPDVPSWAAPYVGYCVSEGLIVGLGNGLFGSTRNASKLDYSTVLLKAAGIHDFTYQGADRRAVEAGLLSLGRAAFADLTRGDVVYMTHALWYSGAIGR